MDGISFSPNSVQPAAAVEHSSAQPVDPAARAYNQAVSQAVRTLNEAGYAGEGREITFSLEKGSSRPVIKVVDVETHEVVFQWPSEYLLQLAVEQTATDNANQHGIQDESL